MENSAPAPVSAPEVTTDGPETTPDINPAPPAVKKHKVKVDEEEFEVDETELLRGYQRGKAATKRFEESAKVKKQAEQFIHQLRTNPKAILTNPKLALPIEVLEEILADHYGTQMLTPEEIEYRKEQAELTEYRSAKDKAKKDAEDAEEEEARNSLSADYERQLMDALKSNNVPKTKDTTRRMLDYASQAIKKGFTLDMDDIAQMVKEDYAADARDYFSALDVNDLIQILGDGSTNKIRTKDLESLRPRQPNRSVPKTAKAESRPTERRQMNNADFMREMRREVQKK